MLASGTTGIRDISGKNTDNIPILNRNSTITFFRQSIFSLLTSAIGSNKMTRSSDILKAAPAISNPPRDTQLDFDEVISQIEWRGRH